MPSFRRSINGRLTVTNGLPNFAASEKILKVLEDKIMVALTKFATVAGRVLSAHYSVCKHW